MFVVIIAVVSLIFYLKNKEEEDRVVLLNPNVSVYSKPSPNPTSLGKTLP